MTVIIRKFLNKVFRDKLGRVVIWQNPNLPLWGWITSVLAGIVVKSSPTHSAISQFGMAALFTWAYLEIRSGITLFRRIIGVIVMIVIIYGLFKAG